MKERIVIPIDSGRLKLWTLRTVEAAAWVICLGLLAGGAVIAGGAALAWMAFGSEIALVFGSGAGLFLILAGARHLLRLLDRTASRLREQAQPRVE